MSQHNTRDCPCASWCQAYGVGHPGEYHHRDCKHWHRDIGEAVLTKTEMIVLGTPDPDDESHNCDWLGCTSVSHVLFRFPRDTAALVQSTPQDAGEAVLFFSKKSQRLIAERHQDGAANRVICATARTAEFSEPLYTTPQPERPALVALTEVQKLDIVTNWFSDEGDIKRAMQMLTDYDQTSGIGGAPKSHIQNTDAPKPCQYNGGTCTRQGCVGRCQASQIIPTAMSVKLEIPPGPADAKDVIFADGWNGAIDAYFTRAAQPRTIVDTARDLINIATGQGLVVTIEREPLPDLAMGNARYVVSCRELRSKKQQEIIFL